MFIYFLLIILKKGLGAPLLEFLYYFMFLNSFVNFRFTYYIKFWDNPTRLAHYIEMYQVSAVDHEKWPTYDSNGLLFIFLRRC